MRPSLNAKCIFVKKKHTQQAYYEDFHKLFYHFVLILNSFNYLSLRLICLRRFNKIQIKLNVLFNFQALWHKQNKYFMTNGHIYTLPLHNIQQTTFYVLYFIKIYWEHLISEVFEFSCFKAFHYIMGIQNVLNLKTYTWKQFQTYACAEKYKIYEWL